MEPPSVRMTRGATFSLPNQPTFISSIWIASPVTGFTLPLASRFTLLRFKVKVALEDHPNPAHLSLNPKANSIP